MLLDEEKEEIWQDITSAIRFNSRLNKKAFKTIIEGLKNSENYISRIIFGARAIDDTLATKLAGLIIEY